MFNITSNYNNAFYNFSYQFSQPKSKVQDVIMTWLVLGTFLPTQNIRHNMYLQSILVVPPKI